MGNFSRDTFDKLKHYVGVRLQQGVPLVDADWNEQEDIRKFELQSFLKWFVGNGVPKGNDGFHILPLDGGADNDFIIKGGDGTPEEAGRCLVEGWDVLNESDIRYTDQLLYKDASLAKKWGVQPLEPLAPPPPEARTRSDLVHLDVWEREVNAEEEPELINPAIGMETCVRIKREWVVRIAEGKTTLPTTPLGHALYPLATLARQGGDLAINEEDITDLRTTGLIIEHHLSRKDNPHAITVDQIGALATSAYEFSNRATAEVAFTEIDADGASRPINIGFTPKFVWAVSYCNVKLGNDLCGANSYGYADLRGSVWQYCTGTKIFRYATVPYWRQETNIWGQLFRAIFYDETTLTPLNGYLGAYIYNVSESGLKVGFSRGFDNPYGYQGLQKFEVKLRILLLG